MLTRIILPGYSSGESIKVRCRCETVTRERGKDAKESPPPVAYDWLKSQILSTLDVL